MSREIRSPVYQIDFTAVDAGKRIATTKRRIRWRFGFTNQDALAAGGTGTECRGEEHDVTLIWSLTSGKRLVLCDGQEVHYSNNRSQNFDFSWTMRGNHVLKVSAHANTPINAHPNFRQYDFFVDGLSFFSMPKVYRLGLVDTAPTRHQPGALIMAESSRGQGAYANYGMPGGVNVRSAQPKDPSSLAEIETPHNADEEEAYLKEAIKQSLSEVSSKKLSGSASVGHARPESNPNNQNDLLLDLISEPGPVPAPVPSNQMVHMPAQTGSYDAYSPFATQQQQPFQQQRKAPPSAGGSSYGFGSSIASSDPFAPQPVPFAAPPSNPAPVPPVVNYNTPPVPPSSAATVPPPPPQQLPDQEPSDPPPETPAPVAGGPVLTMAPQTKGLGSDANDAYAKFASMDQFDLVKPKIQAENPFEATVAAANVPPPTLAGMKANNTSTAKKEVMKSNSVVISGTQSGNWGGYGGVGGYGMNGAAAAPAPQQYGQPPMQQQQGYGQPPMQPQMQYGGAPQYGQPPMQQQQQVPPQMQYGQPPMQQQQQVPPQMQYGQPPMQQQQQVPPQMQYGGAQQYGQYGQTPMGYGQPQQQPF